MAALASAEILNAFYETTLGVFHEVTGLTPTRTHLALVHADKTEDDLAVIIGVTGDLQGNVVLGMTRGVAKRIAGAMAGFEVPAYDQLVDSAMAELANIITGRASARLEELGRSCSISPPAVVSGRGVVIDSVDIDAIRALFDSELGKFTLTLALRAKT